MKRQKRFLEQLARRSSLNSESIQSQLTSNQDPSLNHIQKSTSDVLCAKESIKKRSRVDPTSTCEIENIVPAQSESPVAVSEGSAQSHVLHDIPSLSLQPSVVWRPRRRRGNWPSTKPALSFDWIKTEDIEESRTTGGFHWASSSIPTPVEDSGANFDQAGFNYPNIPIENQIAPSPTEVPSVQLTPPFGLGPKEKAMSFGKSPVIEDPMIVVVSPPAPDPEIQELVTVDGRDSCIGRLANDPSIPVGRRPSQPLLEVVDLCGSSDEDNDDQTAATNAPSDIAACPICGLRFAGDVVANERSQHVELCIKSMKDFF
uniref:Uncharacterized protein n=1 Tax=Spongospora subterranea TaxID=70186 RepID=A0A0H5RC20_9EUKA|eukprot:CRZ11152.1 hypothetical protein [Spongospora subterranea]